MAARSASEYWLAVAVGPGLLGRVVDPLGVPMDGRPLTDVPGRRQLQSNAPDPMKRHRIRTPLPTGVRTLDGLLTVGTGQRVAVMAGSGVGKSTLMGMVAKNSKADINVVALIGERGREVREFLERDLGPEGLARSVVVLAPRTRPRSFRSWSCGCARDRGTLRTRAVAC